MFYWHAVPSVGELGVRSSEVASLRGFIRGVAAGRFCCYFWYCCVLGHGRILYCAFLEDAGPLFLVHVQLWNCPHAYTRSPCGATVIPQHK